jgi:DNA repair protein RadC
MTIRNWPSNERPREKLLARGIAALSDAELLAILLGCGRRGQTAVDLGRELLSRDGGLKSLLELGATALSTLPGMGTAKACRLHAALELGRRYLAVNFDRPDALANPLASAEFVRAKLGGYPYEVFACLFLDSRNRMIAFEELFRGSINGANVHLREVVRRCLVHNAAAVIFAHNHPSGIAEPSQADKEITVELKRALRMIDVRVHDHLVIGSNTTTSLAQLGLV